MSRPPLHSIAGFVSVARHGTLSAAAAELHLTVSALSHQVRGLEDRLRVRLFVRGPRGVRLTADGERLYREIGPHYEASSAHCARPRSAAPRRSRSARCRPSARAGSCRACRRSSRRIPRSN